MGQTGWTAARTSSSASRCSSRSRRVADLSLFDHSLHTAPRLPDLHLLRHHHRQPSCRCSTPRASTSCAATTSSDSRTRPWAPRASCARRCSASARRRAPRSAHMHSLHTRALILYHYHPRLLDLYHQERAARVYQAVHACFDWLPLAALVGVTDGNSNPGLAGWRHLLCCSRPRAPRRDSRPCAGAARRHRRRQLGPQRARANAAAAAEVLRAGRAFAGAAGDVVRPERLRRGDATQAVLRLQPSGPAAPRPSSCSRVRAPSSTQAASTRARAAPASPSSGPT